MAMHPSIPLLLLPLLLLGCKSAPAPAPTPAATYPKHSATRSGAIATASAVSQSDQASTSPLSVAEAIKQEETIGLNTIRVKGHFWWGKEGSMIYDKGYKPILLVGYSTIFNTNHTYATTFGPDSGHKSNVAVVTGHFEHEPEQQAVSDY